MGFFGWGGNKPKQTNLQSVLEAIEHILQTAGVNLTESRQKNIEGIGWKFKQGSATIEIYLAEKAGKHYFQVLSPIMYVPQSGLLPFYRRLLEMNMLIASLKFGIYGDIVMVFHERPTDGLDYVEAMEIITEIAQTADEYDNALVHEFGGRLYQGL